MESILKIPLTGDPEVLFQKARSKADQMGLSLDGDAKKGSFAGLGAQGTFVTDGSTLIVTLTKKPAMFPQAMIEAMVKKMFS